MCFRQEGFVFFCPPPPNKMWNAIGQRSQKRSAAFLRNAFLPRDQSPESRRGVFTHQARRRSSRTQHCSFGFAEKVKNREMAPDVRTCLLWHRSDVSHATLGKNMGFLSGFVCLTAAAQTYEWMSVVESDKAETRCTVALKCASPPAEDNLDRN